MLILSNNRDNTVPRRVKGKKAMKILLTNDDGIYAEGMCQLVELMRPLGHELTVVAPHKNNSGAGHAITLWREVEIRKIEPVPGISERWYVDGTPVDAVKFALGNHIIAPDLVVSGINNGPNMGRNTFYSGTVGAALEAQFHGICSVALSVHNWSEPLWDPAITHGRTIIKHAVELAQERKRDGGQPFLLNANFPDLPAAQIKGFRATRQGQSGFVERFYPSEGGKPHHYFLAGDLTAPDTDPQIDTVAVSEGYISITPLYPQITSEEDLSSMQDFINAL